jgi:hypothetical protein
VRANAIVDHAGAAKLRQSGYKLDRVRFAGESDARDYVVDRSKVKWER